MNGKRYVAVTVYYGCENKSSVRDADAADEGKFERGFVEIDAEIQTEQIQLDASSRAKVTPSTPSMDTW